MHRVFVDQVIPNSGESLTLDGDEATHALRVKRVAVGESVELLDGAGAVARAQVRAIHRPTRAKDAPTLELEVLARNDVTPPAPSLEVLTATPKGGRVDEMVDQLSQIGAAAWGPLHCARSVVDPRENKLDRLERIAREAAKQCGRAWLMRVHRVQNLEQSLRSDGVRVIMADASGEVFAAGAAPKERVRLLIGPEGGWTADEMAQARAAGAAVVRFGPHAMRIETAAAAAAAVIMAAAR